MTEYLTPSNIMFAIGILGVVFSVFLYFKNPQIREDKKAALSLANLAGLQQNYVDTIMKTTGEDANTAAATATTKRRQTLVINGE